MVWLTDERRLALCPAGTIVRDPHHHESLTRHKQSSGLVEWSCAIVITMWKSKWKNHQLEVAPKSFLPSCFEIRRQRFLWIQQRNWKNGKNLPYNTGFFKKWKGVGVKSPQWGYQKLRPVDTWSVSKEYKIKTKMVQEQWLQLKMMFLLGFNLKIVI